MKRGLVWSVVATVFGVVGSLFVTPALVARLGPAEFGLYILVLTVAAYASFFDLGLTWASGRYFADDAASGRRDDLVARFFTVAWFLAGVGLVSVVCATVFGPPMLRRLGAEGGASVTFAPALAAASFAVTLQSTLFGTLLRGCQRFDEAGRVNTLGSLLLPLGSYVAVRAGAGLPLLLAINVSINLVLLALYARHGRRELRGAPGSARWAPRYLREMASFGGWSMSTGLCGIVVLQVDRLAVVFLGSMTGLTYYAVPASVAARVNAIGTAAAGLFFSRASALHAGGNQTALRQQHAAVTRVLLWVTVAAAAPLALLGDAFLRTWIGPDMATHGGLVLVVLVLGYAVTAIGTLDAVTLEGCGRPELPGRTVLVWSALAVAFVIALGPTLGVRAVAYAVAGWLVGVGLTNMVLARAVVLVPTGERTTAALVGLVLVVVAAAVAAQLARPWIDGLPSALAGLAGVGVAALGSGFFFILTRGDRALITRQLLELTPALQRRVSAS